MSNHYRRIRYSECFMVFPDVVLTLNALKCQYVRYKVCSQVHGFYSSRIDLPMMKIALFVWLLTLFIELVGSNEVSELFLTSFDNVELIYSEFMEGKLGDMENLEHKCKTHVQKVMADLGEEAYSQNSKYLS